MNVRSGLSSLGIALCLTSLAGCHSAPSQRPMKAGPVDTGAGTLTQARKYLEGRWTLESFEVFPPGGPAITLKGSGTLSYDEFSNLRIEIRADQASSDLLRAAGIEIRDARQFHPAWGPGFVTGPLTHRSPPWMGFLDKTMRGGESHRRLVNEPNL